MQERRWYSPAVGQEMRVRTYGHAGRPMLVFPCQEGHAAEYEGFGMLDVLAPFFASGRLQVITVDSWDGRSWTNTGMPPHQRAESADAYDRYIVDEVVPFIQNELGRSDILTNGCSMGGYWAAQFLFRHPERFAGCLAISGIYAMNLFIGDYMDEKVYYHVPLAYLKNLNDPKVLNQLRQKDIAICVGQGAWEEPMLTETRLLKDILAEKQIPAWIDIWGHDVDHDWPWWKKMMPYFLNEIL